MEVDLLIFDLDDTLVDWAQRATVARQRVAELLARRLPGTVAEWLQVLEQRDGDLWEKVLAGELLQEEMAALRMQRVVAKLNGSHTTEEIIAEAIQIQQLAMLETARVDTIVHTLLASLRQHYKLHLLTNGVGSLQWPTIRQLELEEYFDEILICSELRSYKPHPFPFREALARANCEPHRACMIGDSWHEDIQGAGQLNMKTIWLNRYGIPSPDGDHAPDHEVTNVQGLFPIFNLLAG